MKKNITRITFFSVLILATIFFKINQEAFGTELKGLATTIRDNGSESSSANNESDNEYTNEEYDASAVYVSNNSSSKNNNTEVSNYSSTTNTVSAKNEIAVEPTTTKTLETKDLYAATYNTPISFSDYGPNNSINIETQNNSYSNQIPTSTTIEEEKASSSREATSFIMTQPTSEDNAIPIITSGAPNSPGGGSGEDPFQAPFDDYYGIIFLLTVSSFVGILGLKKLNPL